ncbi:hypothetical protein HPP92_013414 [Vanilla planifolia]|uniref:Uncharacterized protein n=1 Tax=Vanilla planifolia TaxID=51239 RepID=A0A835QZ05_VANPL|nr:hypothetical protein HPP92_013414 [Vanilla planifolia]
MEDPSGVRGVGGGSAMFTTGSGRTVSIRADSFSKARALFEKENFSEEAGVSECFPMFRTGSGKAVQVRQTSIKKAEDLLEGTNDKEDMLPKLERIDKGSVVETKFKIGTSSHGDPAVTFKSYPNTYSSDFFSTGMPVLKDVVVDHTMCKYWDAGSTCSPKFHTAGGRYISLSNGAIKHAKRVLNDLELETFDNDTEGKGSGCSTCEDEKKNNKDVHDSRCDISYLESINTDINIAHQKVSFSKATSGSIPGGPLVDISNCTGLSIANKKGLHYERKRPRKGRASSSFKKPRTSKFSAPLNNRPSNLEKNEAGQLPTSVDYLSERTISSRYPFQVRRKKINEFFWGPPGQLNMLEHLPDDVKYMTADNAEKYKFIDNCSSNEIGLEDFQDMLLQSGALLSRITKNWVANHYKWIVWKLACLERCYAPETNGKLLTVSNVLEELKYRYDREVNYGHRSALKKVLDGDLSPSSMMILCISAIRSRSGAQIDEGIDSSNLQGAGKKLSCSSSYNVAKIELTDGWYSMNAMLDMYLSNQIPAGKLFVGQKLRVWGSALCGWVGPISPLEALNTVSLVLHVNGTYRAHWAESLGLCKGIGAPLAFRCIKASGGKVPRTLVGIKRIYPILYKERLTNGGSIVRSESMEKKVIQFYNQRRNDIAEDITLELQDVPLSFNESEEGAKILKILECSTEPEVLMAGMSSEQLISFSTYQEKKEALRRANLLEKIEKAIQEAGLGSRDVTPFMRVRVTGLIKLGSFYNHRPREGLITIWNPTEKQKVDLLEGQIYSVSGLTPLSGGSDFLHLQSRGSSSAWNRLPATYSLKFEPFFIPRHAVKLLNLGEVPPARENSGFFVTDGSGCNFSSLTEDQCNCLLAIRFCLPGFGNDSPSPIGHWLSGTTVGWCNLIKRAKDCSNHLWVAEATENSTYSVGNSISCGSHLKEAADSALRWARESSSALQMLKERALHIIGGHGI